MKEAFNGEGPDACFRLGTIQEIADPQQFWCPDPTGTKPAGKEESTDRVRRSDPWVG